jgi:23S rRNA (uracil1939-C5)-methyltransferase
MIKKNDIIELDIENCDLGGSGIGRYEGMAIFVPHTASGDRISARVLKVKKTYAYAKIEKILTPSPDRIDCPCPVYGRCGGCAFGHISYEAELKIKENHVKECFRRIAGIEPRFEPVIHDEKVYAYRNKAQFPVAENGGEIITGFYASHSHRVVDCPSCLLQPPEFAGITAAVKEYMKKYGVSAYDEVTGKGLIRHIFIRKAVSTGEIAVCPVINGRSLPHKEEFCRAVLDACPDVKSIMLNINTGNTNVILGSECVCLYGESYITDILCSLKFRISPLSFYQVNHAVAGLIYTKALEYAAPGEDETVLDLYCGTGTIGLSLAHAAKEVIGVEIVPQAVEDAKINAEINGINNARFICGDAKTAALTLKDEGITPGAVILDPPRKGCSPEVIKTVAQMKPRRIVYVSCDPATLARDCALFAAQGYNTALVTPADMFPRTGNCESVALLKAD